LNAVCLLGALTRAARSRLFLSAPPGCRKRPKSCSCCAFCIGSVGAVRQQTKNRQAHVDIEVQGFAIGLVKTHQASCYDASPRLKTDYLHRSFQVFAPLQQVRDTGVPVVEHKAITGLKVSSVRVATLLTQRVDCWLAQMYCTCLLACCSCMVMLWGVNFVCLLRASLSSQT